MTILNRVNTKDLMRVATTNKRYLFIDKVTHAIRLNNGADSLKNKGVLIIIRDDIRATVIDILRCRAGKIDATYARYAIASTFSKFLDMYGLNITQYEKLKKITR